MKKAEKIVGVIGGMGPEATVEFQRRLIAAVPARDDIDHLHVLVDNNPKAPSRIAALIDRTGEDPAPVLREMARGLERQGAGFLVIPCNTAHHYLPVIAKAVRIPVLDMIALSIAALGRLNPKPKRIGILASPAVRLVGLVKQQLGASGFEALFPDKASEEKVLGVIKAVKAGRADSKQRKIYAQAASALRDADALLVACTELSILGWPPGLTKPCIDTLDVLVAATVAEAKG